MPPIVEGNDAESGPDQGLDPIGIAPVDSAVRGEAMNEEDGVSVALV
jgi:hypothetical protein